MPLDGKVAIVTGGGSGIGAALASELRRRSARVVTLSGRQYTAVVEQTPVPAAAIVGRVLRSVERNRPLIVAPPQAEGAWHLARLSPRVMDLVARSMAARVQRRVDAQRAGR